MKTVYILVALAQIVSFGVFCKSIEANDIDETSDWINDKRYHSYRWKAGGFLPGVPKGIGCPPLKVNSKNGRVVCTTDTSVHIFCLPECIIGKRLSIMPTAFICRNNEPGHWKSPTNETLPTNLSCD